jgi:8-oxo-dGTP diphosphatase
VSGGEHPRPSLTADVVALARGAGGQLDVLLIRRARDPYAGCWALPGGFCEPGETVEQAAARELAEETGLTGVTATQLHVLSTPGRDPRGWVVSVAHLAWLDDAQRAAARGGDDAAEAAFFRLDRGPDGAPRVTGPDGPVALAFDHAVALDLVLARLASGAIVRPR